MNDEISAYFLNKDEPNRSCLLALRNILLTLNGDISEGYKWRIPCYSYKGKMMCFLNIEKKTTQPYILLADGDQLQHHELEQGDRKRMKIFRLNATEDLPMESLNAIFNEALTFINNK